MMDHGAARTESDTIREKTKVKKRCRLYLFFCRTMILFAVVLTVSVILPESEKNSVLEEGTTEKAVVVAILTATISCAWYYEDMERSKIEEPGFIKENG